MDRKKRSVLLGLAIGDGSIAVNRSKCPHPLGNCYLVIKHAERQLPYLEHKRDLLHAVLGGKPSTIRSLNNNGFPGVKMEKGHRVFRLIRRVLYPGGKKTFTRRVLECLDVQAIALWYMDDGGLGFKRKNGKIHARDLMLNTCVSFEENIIVRDYFTERHGITFTIVKNHNRYRLRCGTAMAKKFIEMVEPFVIPSMRYKVDLQYSGHEHPGRVAKKAA